VAVAVKGNGEARVIAKIAQRDMQRRARRDMSCQEKRRFERRGVRWGAREEALELEITWCIYTWDEYVRLPSGRAFSVCPENSYRSVA